MSTGQPLLHRPDLVVERLVRPVAALVELQDRVDARHAHVERRRVELADDREDVLGRALERRAHRVHPVANAVLRGQAALDLGDVLARAHLLAAECQHGEVGRGHYPMLVQTVLISRYSSRLAWPISRPYPDPL